jgi:hypothetical protein
MRLPLISPYEAMRPYGNAIQVRSSMECRRHERHESRVTAGIWLALAALGCWLAAAYAVGALLAVTGWL